MLKSPSAGFQFATSHLLVSNLLPVSKTSLFGLSGWFPTSNTITSAAGYGNVQNWCDMVFVLDLARIHSM